MSQSTRKLVTLTVHGSAFSFDRYWLPEGTPRRRPRPTRGLILEKRARRSRAGLIAAFSRLHSLCQPQLFVSLTFPGGIWKQKESRDFQDFFRAFCRLLRYHYPHCWFLYKVEWSPESVLHYHLIGSLLPRNHCNVLCLHKKALLTLWERVLGTRYAKGVRVKFDSKHISYLTPRKKRKRDMRCVDILGKRRMWGTINKHNMMFCKRKSLKLTPTQFVRFSELVDAYLSQHSTSISHRKQLCRSRVQVSRQGKFYPAGNHHARLQASHTAGVSHEYPLHDLPRARELPSVVARNRAQQLANISSLLRYRSITKEQQSPGRAL